MPQLSKVLHWRTQCLRTWRKHAKTCIAVMCAALWQILSPHPLPPPPAMFIYAMSTWRRKRLRPFVPFFTSNHFCSFSLYLPDNRNFIHQTSQKFLPCSFSEWKLFPCLLFSFVASAEDEVYYCNLFSFIPLEKNFTTFCTWSVVASLPRCSSHPLGSRPGLDNQVDNGLNISSISFSWQTRLCPSNGRVMSCRRLLDSGQHARVHHVACGLAQKDDE